MNRRPPATRRASIYLITLITVAAIVSMILLGLSLRNASNTQSTIIEQMVEQSSGVLDAAEIAIETIESDPKWKTRAKGSGEVFGELDLGDSVYTSSVIDAATGVKPTDETETYRITLKAQGDVTTSSAQIDILGSYAVDYKTYIKSVSAMWYWPMNESGNPTYAYDKIDNENGTYKDKSVAGAGYNDEDGLVPVFNNSNDHVEIPWDNSFTQSIGSITFWMKFTGDDYGEVYGIFGMLYKSGGLPSISLLTYRHGLYGYIQENGDNNFPGALAMSSTDILTTDEWHHVAFTWGDDGLCVYLDGTRKASKASNKEGLESASALFGGYQPIHVGGAYLMDSGDPVGFEGSIAHFAMYNDQLSSSTVSDLAKIKPDLKVYSIVEESWIPLMGD